MKSVIEFLTTEYNRGLGYHSINTARAALSALGVMLGQHKAGSHPVVVNFLRGVFNLRTPVSRYVEVWDVNKVLSYLKKLSPVKYLSLKDLTLKLTMLIALTNAARVQTVHLLSVNDLKKLSSKFVLYFDGLLKQSRPGHEFSFIELCAYPPDRRLCVYTVLKEYLSRTKSVRKSTKKLLLRYMKPYTPVSRDTISRWLKIVMLRSGIDTNQFKAHSIRAAATSKASDLSVPTPDILKAAGWSNASTFARFYKKSVKTSSTFAEAVVRL